MATPFPCSVPGYRWRTIASGIQALVRLSDWKVVATLKRVENSRRWRCNDGRSLPVAEARLQAEKIAIDSNQVETRQ